MDEIKQVVDFVRKNTLINDDPTLSVFPNKGTIECGINQNGKGGMSVNKIRATLKLAIENKYIEEFPAGNGSMYHRIVSETLTNDAND